MPLTEIAPHYDALLFAYGASRDRKLGIPGEDLSGVYSARSFVGWYNGLPEYADFDPKLDSSEEAVIIGQGNVALDVTRTLLSPLDRLRHTDISTHALEALSKNKVRRVRVVGRRGPLQASYTIKEVRELMHLAGVHFEPPDDQVPSAAAVKKLPRQLRRLSEVILKGSLAEKSQAMKSWELIFLRTPVSFEESQSQSGVLGAVNLAPMQFTTDLADTDLGDLDRLRGMKVKPIENAPAETITTGLTFRSVGYQSEAIEGFEHVGIPFDAKMGIIPNDLYGRVMAADRGPGGLTAGHVPGMYCAGWVKRGPTGVIASTMDDAFVSADIVAKDWSEGVPFIRSDAGNSTGDRSKLGWEAVKKEASRRGIRSVSWADWEIIDAEEKRRGQAKGKEREKCKSVAEMLSILDG